MTDIDAAAERCADALAETSALVTAAFVAAAIAAGYSQDRIARALRDNKSSRERIRADVLADFRRQMSMEVGNA